MLLTKTVTFSESKKVRSESRYLAAILNKVRRCHGEWTLETLDESDNPAKTIGPLDGVGEQSFDKQLVTSAND